MMYQWPDNIREIRNAIDLSIRQVEEGIEKYVLGKSSSIVVFNRAAGFQMYTCLIYVSRRSQRGAGYY